MADETRRVIFSDENDPPPPPTGGGGGMHTRRVEEVETVGTFRVGEEEAVTTAPAGEHHPLGCCRPDVSLCGNCRVEHTLQPHETQRPGLYLCNAPEGQVMVKVAAAHYPPKAELWQKLGFPQPPARAAYLPYHGRRRLFLRSPGILYRRHVGEPGAEAGEKFAPPSPEWIMDVFVLQMATALKYLHEQEIIHRDVKPANIYLKTVGAIQALVLGDFEFPLYLRAAAPHVIPSAPRAPGIYTAPEAFPRFVDDSAGGRRGRITRSSDYYSLGITIIELLLGTTSLHLCQLPDLFDFYLQGGRVEIPQGIPGRLTLLLRGLLIRNRHSRWGAVEVERWLNNATYDEDLKKIHDDEYYELARASRPYRLKNYFAVDLPSLAEAMFREPEIASEDLITGDILLNWIGNLDPTVAREIRRDRDQWYSFPRHGTDVRHHALRPHAALHFQRRRGSAERRGMDQTRCRAGEPLDHPQRNLQLHLPVAATGSLAALENASAARYGGAGGEVVAYFAGHPTRRTHLPAAAEPAL